MEMEMEMEMEIEIEIKFSKKIMIINLQLFSKKLYFFLKIAVRKTLLTKIRKK